MQDNSSQNPFPSKLEKLKQPRVAMLPSGSLQASCNDRNVTSPSTTALPLYPPTPEFLVQQIERLGKPEWFTPVKNEGLRITAHLFILFLTHRPHNVPIHPHFYSTANLANIPTSILLLLCQTPAHSMENLYRSNIAKPPCLCCYEWQSQPGVMAQVCVSTQESDNSTAKPRDSVPLW